MNKQKAIDESYQGNIVDTHFHVFGPEVKFPYSVGRSYTPPDASLDDYQALTGKIGITSCVIVQPSVYGTDNRCLLDAMRRATIPIRGVVVVDESISNTDLERMHTLGVRAARINLVFKAGRGFETARKLAGRIKEFGWHFQYLVNVAEVSDFLGEIEGLGVPAVFDHFGHAPANLAMTDKGFDAMCGLLADGLAWVKLSGAYRISQEQHPPFTDVAPLAHKLIETNPDRLLWATDWPHSAIHVPSPNDAELKQMALAWMQDETLRMKIFEINANQLYGFTV